MHLLLRNHENKKIFPPGLLIAANRRRRNIGEIIKPTIPKKFINHGPHLEAGSFPCSGANISPCHKGAYDLCKHVPSTRKFTSPWDGRNWNLRRNVTCTSPNIIYLIICNCANHSDTAWYIGSAVDMKKRWRNHKSDFLANKISKCGFSHHASESHPEVPKYQPLPYIQVIFLESVGKETQLLARETWWQTNIGTIFFGLNKRRDTRTITLQNNRKESFS